MIKTKVECPECGGTGQSRAVQEAKQPEVIGRPNNQQVAPPAGSVDNQPMQDVELAQERPRPKAKAKGKAKKASLNFGRHGEIDWDAEAGLIINLTLGKACLLGSCGSLTSFVGFALLAQDGIGWYLLGGVLVFLGSGCILKGNYQRCLNLLQSLRPPTPKGSGP